MIDLGQSTTSFMLDLERCPPPRFAQCPRSRERTARMRSGPIAPGWAAATKSRDEIIQNRSIASDPHEPETLLPHQVVEIREAMIDARVAYRTAHRTGASPLAA